MRVLFFTASAIAACIASVGSAVRLEEQSYENYAQINVFESEPVAPPKPVVAEAAVEVKKPEPAPKVKAPEPAPEPKPVTKPVVKPEPAPQPPKEKAPAPEPEKKEVAEKKPEPKVAPKPAPKGQMPAQKEKAPVPPPAPAATGAPAEPAPPGATKVYSANASSVPDVNAAVAELQKQLTADITRTNNQKMAGAVMNEVNKQVTELKSD